MADVYQEQAQFFANVPLMQSGVVASVHLEDVDDKLFWDVMLQKQHPGRYYFITQSRSPKGFDTKGCEQCLKYRPYLSKHFFVCIDSDLLCRGTSISFRNDVLVCDLPPHNYWEIKKVASDIAEIISR